MSPLGCMRDAKAALQAADSWESDGNEHVTRIGAGAYRVVYEDKRGVFVYKVARDGARLDYYNRDEHETSEKARKRGVPGIPRTYLWEVDGRLVLCMRRYPDPEVGRLRAKQGSRDRILRRWLAEGFGDLHMYNYTFTRGGQPRLLDMQFGCN